MSLPNILSPNFLVPFVAMKNDFSRAIRGLRGMPRRLLLVGHRRSFGLAPLGKVTTITTEKDALDQLGERSTLIRMWRAAKANADLGLPIDVLPVQFGSGGAAATSTLVITNAAGNSNPFVSPGELMLYIHGERIAVGVTTSDTPATVATKLIAAISAHTLVMVSAGAGANTNEVLLTALMSSSLGNMIDLRTTYRQDESLPEGMTVTVPAMSGGVGVPDLSAIGTILNGYRPTEIVSAFTDADNLVHVETELEARWQANNMQDGQLCISVRGTEGGLTTLLNARNSPHVHAAATTKDATNPWETAAMAGAAIESLAAKDPALPVTGVKLLGYMGPKQGDGWTVEQQNNILTAGGMPLQIAQDYTGSLLRAVTNYKHTVTGAPDRSMAELPWIKTMSYKRWFTVTEFQTKYQGFKLAQYITEPIPGQKIMTPELAEEVMLTIYKLFMDAGLCQHQAHYRETLLVEIDGPSGKLKIQDEPVLVTQHYQTEVTSYVVAGQV